MAKRGGPVKALNKKEHLKKQPVYLKETAIQQNWAIRRLKTEVSKIMLL